MSHTLDKVSNNIEVSYKTAQYSSTCLGRISAAFFAIRDLLALGNLERHSSYPHIPEQSTGQRGENSKYSTKNGRTESRYL